MAKERKRLFLYSSNQQFGVGREIISFFHFHSRLRTGAQEIGVISSLQVTLTDWASVHMHPVCCDSATLGYSKVSSKKDKKKPTSRLSPRSAGSWILIPTPPILENFGGYGTKFLQQRLEVCFQLIPPTDVCK